MKEEIWRKVKGFEDYYEVSNTGKVRSISREIKRGTKGNYFQEGKEIKPSISNKGYYKIHLWVNGKTYNKNLHRLVAEAFIDNPNNYPIINHKDENPQNNNVENLEWCSYSYNINYGTANDRRKETISKPIYQLDKETKEIIKKWNCANDIAQYYNCSRGRIFGWCQDYAEAEGYIWCYVEDYEKGYKGIIRNKYGVKPKPTEEEIKRIEIKKKNRNRPIYKINISDYSVIKEYNNINEAKNDGVDYNKLYACLSKRTKKYNNFFWCYSDEYNDMNFEELKKTKGSKAIIMYDLKTKEIIKKWDSMTEMYNKDGYAITLVGKCCKNILNSAYGYGWRYADNFQKPKNL